MKQKAVPKSSALMMSASPHEAGASHQAIRSMRTPAAPRHTSQTHEWALHRRRVTETLRRDPDRPTKYRCQRVNRFLGAASPSANVVRLPALGLVTALLLHGHSRRNPGGGDLIGSEKRMRVIGCVFIE